MCNHHYRQNIIIIAAILWSSLLMEHTFILFPLFYSSHRCLGGCVMKSITPNKRKKVISYPPFGFGKVLLKLCTHAVFQVLLWCTISCNPRKRREVYISRYKISTVWEIALIICTRLAYHSCQSASCAVILSIWSTSISRQTSSLADRKNKCKDETCYWKKEACLHWIFQSVTDHQNYCHHVSEVCTCRGNIVPVWWVKLKVTSDDTTEDDAIMQICVLLLCLIIKWRVTW